MSEPTQIPTTGPVDPPVPPPFTPAPPTPPATSPSQDPVDTNATIDTVERGQVDIETAKENGVVESNVWPGVDIETGERTDGSAEPDTEESK